MPDNQRCTLSYRTDVFHTCFAEALRAAALVTVLLSSIAAREVSAQEARVPTTRPASPGVLTRVDTSQLRGLRYRMIGPARGGRVTTVTGVPQQPMTFYMGTVGGGVWKTTNAGISWSNISDGFFAVGSIGSIDVADSDPNIIYVGTGSEGIRSNVSIGRGIYKSINAGRTWTFAGLADAGQIGSVVIDPTNPDVAYAAAVGNPFKANPERGVYRTRDGGTSWKRVLFISDSTGAVDLELQPGKPNVIYAAMWRAERKPWTIISGAREGGIYKSTDGGDTWARLQGGLPNGLVGKADLAVSPAAPDRLYVLIEASPGGGLYRSDDAGSSFVAVDTTTRGLITRPFYYTNIDADPANADVVYVGTESYYKSTDGGRTWATMSTPHGDNHDLWINPRNSAIMIQSNDGGANISLDGGRSWSTQNNQPTAEIYQVYVDNQVPYRVYGAQQDENNELIITSLPPTAKPVDDPTQNWTPGPGCETGPVMPHSTNPDTVYGGCKGQFSRMSLRTGQEKQYWIGDQSLYGNPGKDLVYRFQRVSPMEASPHDPRVIYFGSQYLHRTRDEGVTWERISPDLTWNPPERQQRSSGEPITIDATGEEVYSTLYAIRESPLQRGLIWTGSNDGPFFVTRDDGRTWKNVTPTAQPKGCRVQNIEPSPQRAASAYYAVLCYLLGDFKPYLWRTDDYGASWTLLTNGNNGIPADYPTRVVREDPERQGLLYAGTEFGAFVSFDNGSHWQPLQLNLPVTPVTDMKIHRSDLVLSTQGRSFWILDDVTPLRQLTDRVVAQGTHLLRPRDAYRIRYSSGFGGGESNRTASGDPQYPPQGAMIDYWVGASTPGSITLDVLDGRGSVIRTFSSEAQPDSSREMPPDAASLHLTSAGTTRLTKTAGLNRVTWDFAYPGPWEPGARRSGRGGPLAPPGRYAVRFTANGATETQPLTIIADPRITRDGVTPDVLRSQLAHNLRVRDMVSEVNLSVAQLQTTARRLRAAAPAAGETLARLASLEERLVTPPVRYSRPALQSHIQYLYSATTSADQKVGHDAELRYAELRKQLDAAEKDLRELISASGGQ
jgi:photosystem II stability/assembly factor-like uncharacterized protein